ncbi:MAG: hypothetical protein KGJ18_09885, partial [Gammaproteobacteria bacterium]|nr:hypothetical protein [Gammaproteobacteria bacterium]
MSLSQIPMISVNAPSRYSEAEIEQFEALVRKGGEVDAAGLRDRIMSAHTLAFARTENSIIGVGALK